MFEHFLGYAFRNSHVVFISKAATATPFASILHGQGWHVWEQEFYDGPKEYLGALPAGKSDV